MAGSSLVALVPTQTVLLLPDVLIDRGMSQLGLGFTALPYLSTFGPYWKGRTPFTCMSFWYFFAPLPLSVCLSWAWVIWNSCGIAERAPAVNCGTVLRLPCSYCKYLTPSMVKMPLHLQVCTSLESGGGLHWLCVAVSIWASCFRLSL